MKLMILGAGVYQLPAIQRARSMGIEAIVLSTPGNYPGVAAASTFLPIDTTDVAACLKAARAERIDGVLSPGTDVALPTLGAIADALSLPGPTARAATRAADKRLMKAAFCAGGVRSPAYREVRTVEDTIAAVMAMGCPAILKVADRSGSRGIERINNLTEVPTAFARCQSATRASSMLVEQFVSGEEFGAQAFVASGQVQFVMPHGDVMKQTAAASVPIGHFVPLTLTANERADICEQIGRCVRALGLDNCALNIDFIRAQGVAHVLEIGARSGATCLAEIVSAYYGIDYYEYMIRCALGVVTPWTFEAENAVAATLIVSQTTGTLTTVPQAPHADYPIDYSFEYNVGDHVRQFTIGPDRIGHVVVAADTLDTAQRRLDRLTTQLHFNVRPDSRKSGAPA